MRNRNFERYLLREMNNAQICVMPLAYKPCEYSEYEVAFRVSFTLDGQECVDQMHMRVFYPGEPPVPPEDEYDDAVRNGVFDL